MDGILLFRDPSCGPEFNNLFIELSNEVDLSDTETVDLTDNEYAEISERMIYEISDAVDIYFSDIEEPFRINVLSDTLDGLDWEYLQPFSVPVSLPDSNLIFEKAELVSPFQIENGKLNWHSMDGRNLVLEVNNSEFFKASVTNVFGEQILTVLPPNLLNRHKYLRCKLKILGTLLSLVSIF